MSTNFKTFKLTLGLLVISSSLLAQVATLEWGQFSSPVTGNGFGPRTTAHQVTFVQDLFNGSLSNNNTFVPYAPTVTATVSFQNQVYTGLTYGSTTPNPVSTGLLFGAGPREATGGLPTVSQQATPLNSYAALGSFTNGFGALGPANNMFTAEPGTGPGKGVDAVGDDVEVTGAVQAFTTAQVLYDLNLPNNGTAAPYYYGDLVITFSQFITNPVIHLAGLGGSYRYQFQPGDPNNPVNYRSTFFSTELELQNPGIYSMAKLSGNTYLDVAGNNIKNNAPIPNGGSQPEVPLNYMFDNYGAASGSVRINGNVRVLRFKVYLRGSAASQFNWSTAQANVINGLRAPLTGDVWYVSVSTTVAQLIPLPATGLSLNGVLNGNNVELKWKTKSEIDSKEFQIERSRDGLTYSPISSRNAVGNSVSETSYSHTDLNMNVPAYYYRVKLVDMDGSFKYSNQILIRKTGKVNTIKVFPNPAAGQTNIEFSDAKGNYAISLFNMAGQEVMTQRSTIEFTSQYVPINRGNLTAGTYNLRIRNIESGEIFSEKIILQ